MNLERSLVLNRYIHSLFGAERFTVRRIGFFGSYLHDVAGQRSDVDILVEMDHPIFDHYMDLKFFLEIIGEAADGRTRRTVQRNDHRLP